MGTFNCEDRIKCATGRLRDEEEEEEEAGG